MLQCHDVKSVSQTLLELGNLSMLAANSDHVIESSHSILGLTGTARVIGIGLHVDVM